jgi:hypothetical protein
MKEYAASESRTERYFDFKNTIVAGRRRDREKNGRAYV